jgi:phosphopantetheinyl transferase (holo-ACP synthase)
MSGEEAVGEIEVAREPGRAPTLRFHGEAKRATEPGAKSHVSISHSGTYAVALVVVE